MARSGVLPLHFFVITWLLCFLPNNSCGIAMTPNLLLTLSLLVVSPDLGFTSIHIISRSIQEPAPDFWWDLTLSHSAPIKSVLVPPSETSEEKGSWGWDLKWAKGNASTWLASDPWKWLAWTWKSTNDPNIRGGGFIYFSTSGKKSQAGADWLQDIHTGEITWNCFVEWDEDEPLPWSEWSFHFATTSIGFIKKGNRWGFSTDSERVLSKHCATGSPAYGKRYKFHNGTEVETSITEDPFKKHSARHKRSPGWLWWENLKRKTKDLWEKFKKMMRHVLNGDEQSSNHPWFDLMKRFLKYVFGVGDNNPGGSPGESPPNSSWGDPPDVTVTTPDDVEEMDL